MLVLTLALLLVPVIPGLNRLPRYLKLYRIIWRDYYREMERGQPAQPVEKPAEEPAASTVGAATA
jgi:hypothetical protein